MRIPRPSARAGLLALAAALAAMLVAVPTAGAATFAQGPITLELKSLKLKVAMVGQDQTTDTKTRGTFQFAEGTAGTLPMTTTPGGTLNIGQSATQITLTHANKKKIVLKSLAQKFTAGKGQLTAKVGGKGKAIAFFDQATTNKVKVPSDFRTLQLESSKMTLTSAGAAALNKAFGLKAPAKGKKDLRLKAKAAVGTVSFTAHRAVTISGGQSNLLYNKAFVDQLASCGISLKAVEPGQAIPVSEQAPGGGVILPASGGQMNVATFLGAINNAGGTVLDRPANNSANKAAYNSALTDFIYGFGETENVLTAFVVNLTTRSPVGAVSGTFGTELNDAGGSLTITNGSLNLSVAAATLLSSKDPPLGADCEIAPGTQIGTFTLTATAN